MTRIGGSGVADGHTYVWNASTLAWEAMSQTSVTVGALTVTGVAVSNWPASYSVTGTVSVAENNQAQVVYKDGSIMYVCKAAITSSVSSNVWQIKKVDCTNGIVIQWCDGNANYDNVATSLLIVKALSYS